jgi:hypothetical protein
MNACRGARTVRGILDFSDLPKNEAADIPLNVLDFAREWLIGVSLGLLHNCFKPLPNPPFYL